MRGPILLSVGFGEPAAEIVTIRIAYDGHHYDIYVNSDPSDRRRWFLGSETWEPIDLPREVASNAVEIAAVGYGCELRRRVEVP